ncbi:MAG TPA: histidine phosphatase family protein [Solirubrobacteraceae bacterium]|nr:histidine phosphatase family protein [Solirubrobacteraceae bacterium]
MLHIVRHGESTWNAEHRLQGQLDPPLSAEGRAQAVALAPLVARLGVPPERVVCSDLGRARETAALLGLEPGTYDPAWREIDVGAWGGRTAAEVDAEADGLTNWRGGARTAPDGEPWEAFAARVARAADALIAAGGPWLVVSHGGCIRATCAHVTGGDALSFGSPPNASLTTIELGPRPRLLSYGVTPDGAPATGLY